MILIWAFLIPPSLAEVFHDETLKLVNCQGWFLKFTFWNSFHNHLLFHSSVCLHYISALTPNNSSIINPHLVISSVPLFWILFLSHLSSIVPLVCVLVAQSCPSLCDPMDYSLPGSSVHRILQVRILEWVPISVSRGSSQPRDWTLD